jgi:hypothetical protein
MENEASSEPQSGLETLTLTGPGKVIRAASTETLNRVELIKVGDNLDDLKKTTAPLWNPVPLIVKVNVGPPASADAGFRLEITGCGALTL